MLIVKKTKNLNHGDLFTLSFHNFIYQNMYLRTASNNECFVITTLASSFRVVKIVYMELHCSGQPGVEGARGHVHPGPEDHHLQPPDTRKG